MWLCAGDDVTRDSEVEQPAPPNTYRRRSAHPEATRAEGWISVGTAHALAWLNLGNKDRTDNRRRDQGRGYGDG